MAIRIHRKNQPGIVKIIEQSPSGKVVRIEKTPIPNKSVAKKLKPQAPTISLSEPGRLRVANMLSLLGISRTTFYAGVDSGRYPPPDGKDGRLPYWNTLTVRKWLQES